MSVWQSSGLPANGPTLSSLLGIVRLNGLPSCAVNSKEISAGREASSEHAMPYVPGSSLYGWIWGEI